MQQRKSMEAYQVSISTTSKRNSELLGTTRKVRYGRVFKKIKRSIANAIAVAMTTVVLFIAVLGGSAPAQADNIVTDGIGKVTGSIGSGLAGQVSEAMNGFFCSQGAMGLKTYDVGFMRPNTGSAGSQSSPTPYEKYGYTGLAYSHWNGFSPEKDNGITYADGQGYNSSVGIIRNLGGDANKAGVDQTESATSNQKGERAGLWNNDLKCGMFSGGAFLTSLGNAEFTVAKFDAYMAGTIYQVVAESTSAVFSAMEKPLTAIVTTLKDKLYFSFLMPMIMLGALWVFYQGTVKRRATSALSSVIWMIGAVAIAVVFMTQPMLMPKTVSGVVNKVSQASMGAITSASIADDNSMCEATTRVNSGSDKAQKEQFGTDANNSASRNNVRQVQCNLWYSFGYTPWVIGQFGVSPEELSKQEQGDANAFITRASQNSGTIAYTEKGFVLNTLKNHSGQNIALKPVTMGKTSVDKREQNWALYLLDSKVNYEGNKTTTHKTIKTRQQMATYLNQLGAKNYNADFRGDNSGSRIFIAFVAAIGSVVTGIMIIILGFTILIMDLGLILLMMIFPLVALVALQPGAGRRVAQRWGKMLVSIAMKRIAISIFLAIMIALMQVTVTMIPDVGFITTTIIMIAVASAGLYYQKQIMQLFAGFGAESDIEAKNPIGSALKQGGKAVVGMTGAAAAVAGVGLAAKGAGAKAAASSVANRVSGAGQTPKGKSTDTTTTTDQSTPTRKNQARQRWQKVAADDAGSTPTSSDSETPVDNDANRAGAGETPRSSEPLEDSTVRENLSGAGAKPNPVESTDTDSIPTVSKPNTQEIPTVGKREEPQVNESVVGSGAGANPVESREAERPSKPNRYDRRSQRASTKRIEKTLKAEGYRSKPTTGNVLKAMSKGALVGAATGGNPIYAYKAASGHLSQVAQNRSATNAAVVNRVEKQEISANKQHSERLALKREMAREKEARRSEHEQSKAREWEQKKVPTPVKDTKVRNSTPAAPAIPTKNDAPTTQKARENAAPVAPTPTTPVSGKHGKPLPKVEKIQEAPANGRRVAAPASPKAESAKPSAPVAPRKAPASPKAESAKPSAPKAPVSAPVAPRKAPASPKAESAKPSAPKAPVSPKAESVTPPKRTETPKLPAPKLPPKRGN